MPLSPSPSSFVGRHHELEDARRALSSARLVTLIGPGGVGKTRVAVEVADQAHRAFDDGIWFVGLADLDPDAGLDTVSAAVLRALTGSDQGTRATRERLLEVTAERHALLVVDNCEHLLEVTAQLCSDLLRAAPRLRILATSREALRIGGEQVLHVPPLSVPEPRRPYSPRDLLTFDAVVLLRERARQTDPGFEITGENAAAVATLCDQLDGLPLAIELAASRLRTLTPEQIVERLADRFTLLSAGDRTAAPRQRSLRAMIDWSHDLCSASTRLLWNRLAVFPGSFDIDAAEQVCGFGELDRHDVFEALDRLVSQSILLTRREHGVVRYHLLVAVREYAREKLDESGESTELRRRHRDFVLSQALDGHAGTPGVNHADVIAALHWSTSTMGEATTALDLAVALGWHWVAEGHLDEGRRWLESLLDVGAEDSTERAHALWSVVWVALVQNDRDGAAIHLEELRRLVETTGDDLLRTHLDHWCGLYHAFSDDPAHGIPMLERAVAGHHRRGDRPLECIARFQLAFALLCDGRLDTALATAEEALAVSTIHELWRSRDWARWIAGTTRWRLADLEAAENDARELLETQRRSQDYLCAAASTALLGWIAASRGEDARASELIDLSDEVLDDIGTSIAFFGPRIVGYAPRHPRANRRRRTSRPCDIDELADRTLRPPGDTGDAGSTGALAGPPPTLLTTRELEVAHLVAEGLSNKAVADRLVISTRTAEGHVERILRKLELPSRAAVASWVHTHGSGT